MAIEENLIDLGWHLKEFQMRYYDAKIFLWVRQSEVEFGLNASLFKTVKEWIAEKWPFRKVAYPRRDINWKEWRKSRLV